MPVLHQTAAPLRRCYDKRRRTVLRTVFRYVPSPFSTCLYSLLCSRTSFVQVNGTCWHHRLILHVITPPARGSACILHRWLLNARMQREDLDVISNSHPNAFVVLLPPYRSLLFGGAEGGSSNISVTRFLLYSLTLIRNLF